MRITDIISKSVKPAIYESGTAAMWSNDHISKQLLNVHLNPDVDLASRCMSTIINTADWILETQESDNKLRILDLGCGPGLYSEIFAQNGHDVTGMDISRTSIEYARESAKNKNLSIRYEVANYLEIEPEAEKYDLIILIYTDLGVLNPNDRQILLNIIYRSLKKGGRFIFDVLKDKNIDEKVTPATWEASESGFWKQDPYVALSHSFLYIEQKVILYQHIIMDTSDIIKTYRFWTHFFSQNDIIRMITPNGYSDLQFKEDVLPVGDKWNGDNVIFCIATK
jgi:ubiquinone/menaquinone biosynthesis C-methylase UbiE